MKYLSITFACLFASIFAVAQTGLPVPRNMEEAYEKSIRSQTGQPGNSYWQNTAGYVLNIQYNPESLAVQGVESIDYTNNSPDTLHQIVYKLYPNLYQKGAERMMKVDAEDVTDGLQFDSIKMQNNPPKDTLTRGTNFFIRNIAILPHSKTHFDIRYHYTLNKGSHIRTGEIEPGAAFIAYFFPRIAVYDDIDGWNVNPYIGTQEFYNDFCHFSVNITVPKNYLVWCTGSLLNGQSVLTDTYWKRLQQAEQSNDVITIIDSTDIHKNNITADKPMLTWQYEADNVTDVAFAVSNHYMWQSSSLIVDSATRRRTRVDAVFAPKHKDYLDVVSFAKKTVESMSFTFPKWPYPYPHETVFDGLDQMEYPMMVNDNPLEEKEDAIELTDHEIFHTMFPFYMGINETKYAWMDEGWATIGEWLISPMIDTSIKDNYGVAPYENSAGTEEDLPITTLSTQETGTAYFLNSYPKPAFGYLYVKNMLGDQLFTKALHHYITLWQGKHPVPLDFFNSMNEGAGQNMNWFWKRWYYDAGVPDLGITGVKQRGGQFTVTVTNKGGKPVPVDLVLHYADSTTFTVHENVSVWKSGDSTVTFQFTAPRKITRFTLGSLYTPDTDKSDNEYIIK